MAGRKKLSSNKIDEKVITKRIKELLKTPLLDDAIIEELKSKGVKEQTELSAMCLLILKEARKSPSVFKEIIDRVEGKIKEEDKPFDNEFKVVIVDGE